MDVGGVATRHGRRGRPHEPACCTAAGWRVVYHDEVMALGLAPEEIGAFVVQRGRWARGLAPDAPAATRPCSSRGLIVGAAPRVHGQLPALPRGAAAPDRLPGARRSSSLTGAVPIDASPLLYAGALRPAARARPARLAGAHPRPLPAARGRALRGRAHGAPTCAALAALPRRRGTGFAGDAEGRPRSARLSRCCRALRAADLPSPSVTVGRRSPTRRPRRCSTWPGRLAAGASTRHHGAGPLVNVALVVYGGRSGRRRHPHTSAAATASRWPCRPPTRRTARARRRARRTSRTSAARAC